MSPEVVLKAGSNVDADSLQRSLDRLATEMQANRLDMQLIDYQPELYRFVSRESNNYPLGYYKTGVAAGFILHKTHNPYLLPTGAVDEQDIRAYKSSVDTTSVGLEFILKDLFHPNASLLENYIAKAYLYYHETFVKSENGPISYTSTSERIQHVHETTHGFLDTFVPLEYRKLEYQVLTKDRLLVRMRNYFASRNHPGRHQDRQHKQALKNIEVD